MILGKINILFKERGMKKMSHFTCYVVVKNDDEINPREGEFDIDEINDRVARQLEPFCEEAEQQYMEFNDLSQDYKDEYKAFQLKTFLTN